MRPGRSFCVSGLIHVILMIQYEKKGAVVMTQTPAYTVIHTLSIRTCREKKELPSLSGRSGTRIISNAEDLLSGQVFPREALPWKNASAESYAENY